MIPVRVVRLLIVLMGISMVLVGAEWALSAAGFHGVSLTLISGFFAGGIVFLLALWGGQTLRFCAKGLVANNNGPAEQLLKKMHCDHLGIKTSVIESKSIFAVSVAEGRAHRIFISTRILKEFSYEAIMGILAHECGHIRNNHPTKQAVILGLVAGVKISLGIPMISALILLISYLWMLREWEFVADAEATQLAGQEALMAAFAEFRLISGEKKDASVFSEIFSGHPSFSRRIKRITGNGALVR